MASRTRAIGEPDRYSYQPVPPGTIRLFHLDPTYDFNDEVFGRIETHRLGQSPYTALSYAWGKTFNDGSHLTESIICNGRRLLVTATLKQALRRVRPLSSNVGQASYHTKARVPIWPLWIDAICINQEDLVERSEQVQMMAQIYARNDVLLIWLGEPDNGELGNRQIDLFAGLDGFDTGPDVFTSSYQNPSNFIRRGFRGPETSGLANSSMFPTDPVSILRSVSSRPWFTRRWVMQETAKSPSHSSYIMLGSAICREETFRDLLLQHGLLEHALPFIKRFSPYSALETFYLYDRCECSDPRDRIFALKDLTLRGTSVPVDYNQDVRNTYLSFVKTVVFGITSDADFLREYGYSREQHVNILPEEFLRMLALATCKRSSSTDEIPLERWVPDWRSQTSCVSPSHSMAVEERMSGRLRDPGGAETPDVKAEITELPSGYTLLLFKNELLIRPITRTTNTISGSISSETLPDRLIRTVTEHWQRPIQQHDRVWIPRDRLARPGTAWRQGCRRPIAFVLRPLASLVENTPHPVYYLYSCFLIDGNMIDGFAYDSVAAIIDIWSERSENEQRRLAEKGILLKQAFCIG